MKTNNIKISTQLRIGFGVLGLLIVLMAGIGLAKIDKRKGKRTVFAVGKLQSLRAGACLDRLKAKLDQRVCSHHADQRFVFHNQGAFRSVGHQVLLHNLSTISESSNPLCRKLGFDEGKPVARPATFAREAARMGGVDAAPDLIVRD